MHKSGIPHSVKGNGHILVRRRAGRCLPLGPLFKLLPDTLLNQLLVRRILSGCEQRLRVERTAQVRNNKLGVSCANQQWDILLMFQRMTQRIDALNQKASSLRRAAKETCSRTRLGKQSTVKNKDRDKRYIELNCLLQR